MSDETLDAEFEEASPGEDVARIVSLMVAAPEEVEVGSFQQGNTTVFKVTVASEDLGKLIGRQGRTARALRTLLDVRGELDGCRYGLEIR